MPRCTLAGPAALLLILVCTLPLGGCDGESSRLEGIYASAATDPGAAAAAMAEQVRAGKVTLDHAMNLAFDRLEGGGGPEARAYAAAVLACATEIERELPQADEYMLFWNRLGRIAFHAANDAREAGRREEAMALVFAGPTRWQREYYWIRYPDHDALGAYILYENGRKSEAVRRLRDRSHLEGPAEQALQEIFGAP